MLGRPEAHPALVEPLWATLYINCILERAPPAIVQTILLQLIFQLDTYDVIYTQPYNKDGALVHKKCSWLMRGKTMTARLTQLFS